MKRQIYSTAICLALLLAGCSKQMDAPMDNRVTLDEVFRSKSRTSNYMNHPYWFITQYATNAGMCFGGSFLASYCDEAQDARYQQSGSQSGDWYRGVSTARSFGFNLNQIRWQTLFEAIRRCNTVIKYLGDPDYIIPASEYSDGYRKYYLAQCYIMRAYHYMELIKRYGPVPIVTTRFEINHDFSNDVRPSFAQCADFIIEDCKRGLQVGMEAEPDLKWKFGSGVEKIEMTAALAWMLKSEAATFAASPLWSEDYEGTEQYTWQKALEITTDALDNLLMAGFSLVDFRGADARDTAENIAAYFLSSPDSDTETIYSAYSSNQPQRALMWQDNGIPQEGSGQLSAGACPTQELVDAYEVVNDALTESALLLDPSEPYSDAAHTSPNITAAASELGYSDGDPYRNRDPRFYASIYYNGSAMGNITVETYAGGAHELDNNPSSIRGTKTGYYFRKYRDPRSDRSANYDGFLRNYRLVHLYFNYIEALNNVCGPTTAYTGEILPVIAPSTALEGLNLIRHRSGMPAVKESEVPDKAAFEQRYRNERRVELALEGQRFFDVRRWQEPDGDLSATDRRLSAMKVTKSGDNAYTYERAALPERSCYDNKYLMFPLPNDEVLKIQNIRGENWQNKNW